MKSIEEDILKVTKYELPIFRCHLLSYEDLIFRRQILNLIGQFYTEWTEQEDILVNQLLNPDALAQFQTDELFVKGNRSIKVTIKGRQFIRNICMLFDAKLVASKKKSSSFQQNTVVVS
ncbi:MAG: oxygen-independent coproporphyrinogen-3 oxidase [Cyclobacteriaceae bacterium]